MPRSNSPAAFYRSIITRQTGPFAYSPKKQIKRKPRSCALC
ncbi:hypothetical protein B0I18_104173 [Taibaiella chishuiensis]|uniref:Uncharacterized protein n=1 Tax=Taibaiella chishuiensis TaxID=1434707 RepID=A0A2P8D4D3_9BACT|nr:hypothetical protein B0I18_104173 [Taibaiella chishuiensis]